MIRYEFSKDFQTWTSTIAGHDIHRDIIDGSYRVITGFTLQLNKHLTNSLSFSLVTDFATRKELMSYRYCRAYKNEQKVFTGILNSDSTTVIESVETVQLDIRYDDFNSLLKSVKVERGKNIEYHEADGIKFLDPSDQTHSLVHILMNLLIAGNPEHNFTFTTDIDYLKQPILYYQLKEGADVLGELDEVFKENGLNYLLNEFAITLIDVMPQTTQGIIIPDIESEAKIQKTNFDDPVKVAPSEAVYYETVRNKYIYDDRDDSWFGKKWWWNTGYELKGGFRYDTDVTCTIPNDVKNHEAVEVKITEAVCGAIDGKKPDARFRRDYYIADTKVYHFSGATGGSLGGSHHGSYILADITYKVTESIIKDKTIVDETLKPIRAKTVFTKESIKRYIESLKIRFALNDSWVFYAKEDLAIGDIVKVQDIEEYSQIRIYEKEDTDDIMGGAVYRAYPDTMPISEWDETLVEQEVENRPDDFPVDIITEHEITVLDDAYVKDRQVFYIISKQIDGKPVVRYEGVEIPVKFDAPPHAPADGENYSQRWYFEFSFNDISIRSYTFTATWNNASVEKTFPVYKTVTPQNYPPIVEYKYSPSPDTPFSDFSAFTTKNAVMFVYGELAFVSAPDEVWSKNVPQGSQYKGMYLWKRTWSYELEKWVYERVTGDKGESAKLFEITAEQFTYNISKRGTPEQRIQFAYTVQNIEGDIVWSSTVGTFDRMTLILPSNLQNKTVEVTATLGDLGRKIILSAIEINNEALYLGVFYGNDVPTLTPSGDSLLEGDYYLAVTLNAEGKAISRIPKRWNGSEWTEVRFDSDDYSKIMGTILADALSQNGTQQEVSALNGLFGNLAVEEAFIRKVVAEHLKVQDAQNKFKMEVAGYDAETNRQAVFDVSYEGRTIFKIVPSKGNIFFGEPDATGDAPVNGFMYNANDEIIVSKDSAFVLDANGRLSVKDADFEGTANVVSGKFEGSIDCPSFSSLPPSSSGITANVSASPALTQYEELKNALQEAPTYQYILCTHSLNSNIKYYKYRERRYGGVFSGTERYYEFFDSNKRILGNVMQDEPDGLALPQYKSTWENKAFVITINFGDRDVFTFKDLPNTPLGLTKGRVYRDGNTLKIV